MKYEITVGEVQAQNSSVKGYASVVFGDSFKVSNIAILADRNNRLYISMPHYKNQDKKKKDICYPTTKSFHGELEANILLSLENLQQTGQKKYLVGDGQDMELPFTVAVTPLSGRMFCCQQYQPYYGEKWDVCVHAFLQDKPDR